MQTFEQIIHPSAIERLLQNGTALAATLMQGNHLLSQEGSLSQAAFLNLAEILRKNWGNENNPDFKHFTAAKLDDQNVLIQARQATETCLIGLVFPFETRLNTIIAHTDEIAHKLAQASGYSKNIPYEKVDQDPPIEAYAASMSNWQPEFDASSPGDGSPIQVMHEPHSEALHESNASLPQTFGSDDDAIILKPHILQDTTDGDQDGLHELPWSEVISFNENRSDSDILQGAPSSQNTGNQDLSEILSNLFADDRDQSENSTTNQLAEQSAEALRLPHQTPLQPEATKLNQPVKHTTPDSKQPAHLDESPDAGRERLQTITFYLVPRLPHHYILGDLPHNLRNWVPQICKDLRWRLDSLSIRPDYLRWTLHHFPEYAIPGMLKIMRAETSELIFNQFPDLNKDNDSGDYWSVSHLIDKGNQYFSTQAILTMLAKEHNKG